MKQDITMISTVEYYIIRIVVSKLTSFPALYSKGVDF